MLVLLETAAGYALFKVLNRGLLKCEDISDIESMFSNSPNKMVQIESMCTFKDTKHAMEEVLHVMDSKVGKYLKKFLKKNILNNEDGADSKLVVGDKALASNIKSKLGIECIFNPQTHEIIRQIKTHITTLLSGISEKDRKQMCVSLSHSLNRFKLRFSPEKLDTMIIQAVSMLDELDRELNNFAMRLKEWYGWHFPELSTIVSDNLAYAKAVKLIGFRTNTKHVDFDTLFPDSIVAEIRMAAETSMGTEMTDEDLSHINALAVRVEELTEYRINLSEYLKLRMKAVAPNLTYMVGEVIGARLLAHSGSLVGLSKQPASTIQILGAEKALFRALKTKSNTPKYGLLYHASFVAQATPKLKGKICRVLAAKLSLCVRVDALTEATDAAAREVGAAPTGTVTNTLTEPTVAIACKDYVEAKLKQFEAQLSGGTVPPVPRPKFQRYEPNRATNGKTYDSAADIVKEENSSTKKKEKKHKHDSTLQEESSSKKKKVKAEREDDD